MSKNFSKSTATRKEYEAIKLAKSRIDSWDFAEWCIDEVDLIAFIKAHLSDRITERLYELCVLLTGGFEMMGRNHDYAWFYMPSTSDCCAVIKEVKYRYKKKLPIKISIDREDWEDTLMLPIR